MFGNGRYVSVIAAEQEKHLPHGECAPLDVSLAACGRVAKIEESKF
jgi:hypothetical protein